MTTSDVLIERLNETVRAHDLLQHQADEFAVALAHMGVQLDDPRLTERARYYWAERKEAPP